MLDESEADLGGESVEGIGGKAEEETYHDDTPCEADAGEEKTRADFTGENCGRRLEEGVGDEEDEGDGGLREV